MFPYRGGLSPALAIVKWWRLRSFRTLMSIEKRVVPFSRSFRSLIKTRAASKPIKDLKDLRALQVAECYRHSGLTDLKRRFFRSANWRGPVPRPTVKGRFFYRSAGACPPRASKHRFFTVARGPVPRDRSNEAKTFFPSTRHGEGQALALR